ncbi:hypothetical protein CDAR_118731 [Caerostris darwini]|uniref:Uncharacterized protein n=1 Tax=Caerostris darwini TaxID=1538125 RepID=A0AAV4TPL9_9ARAC|nr:hypothetical protein CDAR_118731 [Caerostris darwini]
MRILLPWQQPFITTTQFIFIKRVSKFFSFETTSATRDLKHASSLETQEAKRSWLKLTQHFDQNPLSLIMEDEKISKTLLRKKINSPRMSSLNRSKFIAKVTSSVGGVCGGGEGKEIN